MPAPKYIMSKVRSINRTVRAFYLTEVENRLIPGYVESVMLRYDEELVGIVTDRRSRTNPVIYREEFQLALENFEYIEMTSGKTTINLPDIETFPWREGRLSVIENILEGVIGNYIEVDEAQYVAMYQKRPAFDPYDKAVARKQRIYTLKANSAVKRRWQETFPKEQAVRYPFSNMASIDIFSIPNMEFKENLKERLPSLVRKKAKEMAV